MRKARYFLLAVAAVAAAGQVVSLPGLTVPARAESPLLGSQPSTRPMPPSLSGQNNLSPSVKPIPGSDMNMRHQTGNMNMNLFRESASMNMNRNDPSAGLRIPQSMPTTNASQPAYASAQEIPGLLNQLAETVKRCNLYRASGMFDKALQEARVAQGIWERLPPLLREHIELKHKGSGSRIRNAPDEISGMINRTANPVPASRPAALPW